MKKNFETFINDLKNKETFNKYGPCLALLDIGNIDGLVLFGEQMGYGFSKEEVQQFFTSSPKLGAGAEMAAVESPKAPNAYIGSWITQCAK